MTKMHLGKLRTEEVLDRSRSAQTQTSRPHNSKARAVPHTIFPLCHGALLHLHAGIKPRVDLDQKIFDHLIFHLYRLGSLLRSKSGRVTTF